MRPWIVAGNWKMNNTLAESSALAKGIVDATGNITTGEIVLAPPFTALTTVSRAIAGSNVRLAAQNFYFEEKGAYTGEISPLMLKDVGCTYVIIGHSERRKYFHETDEGVNTKARKALEQGLKPIICVGETDAEREEGITEFIVGIQIKKALLGIDSPDNLIIAYEPVWAIGTGKTATPEQAQDVHGFIRNELKKLFHEAADSVRILYGGSVTADNAGELAAKKDIDGALVGGAALKVENFTGIIMHVSEKRI